MQPMTVLPIRRVDRNQAEAVEPLGKPRSTDFVGKSQADEQRGMIDSADLLGVGPR